jgi:phage-related protein
MADNFGLKIGLEGEKEFKKALADINQSFKVLGSEMKLAESSFGKNEKSVESLTARNAVLTKEIDAQKAKIETLRSALDNAASSFGENDRRTQNWQIQLNNAEAALNDMEREVEDNNKDIKDLSDNVDDAGDSAEESGSKFESFGGVLKGVGVALGAVAVAAGAAAVKLGKEVISAYSDYEQLVGGIDTLFKDSSLEMQQYAANAYKTAGMSANEYMETVTGFSASLISSLGGDTEKATKLADMAITDMSDNANKMGSDIQSIQNAYQGFAKGQFNMLDNLKLGYGGTKTEMERLLADAEAISGIHYDVDSYADVVSAIHVIQEEMDIAGTTAREADATISGSLNSMKAAVQNLIVGFGDANADMEQLTENVVDAFETVVKNITPVIENIVKALPTVTGALLSAIADLLPTLLGTVTELFEQVLETILNLLPRLIPAAVEAVITIVNALIENLPLIIDAAVQMVATLVQGLADALPQLIPAAVQAVITIVRGLVENLPLILDAALQLVLGLAQGLLDAIPQLVAALPAIIQAVVDFIVSAIPQIIEAGIQLLTSLVTALPEIIEVIVEAIPQIIDSIINAVIESIPLIIQAGIDLLISLIQALPQIIATIVEAIPQIITAIVDALVGNIDQIILAGVQLFVALIENLPTIIVEIVKAVPQIISAIVKGFADAIPTMANIGLNLVKGIWNGISDAAGWLWEKISGFFDGIVGKIKNFFGIHSPSTLFAEMGGFMAEGLGDGFSSEMDTVGDTMTGATAEAGDFAGEAALSAIRDGLLNNIDLLDEPIASIAQKFGEAFVAILPNFLTFAQDSTEQIANGLEENSDSTVFMQFEKMITEIRSIFDHARSGFVKIGERIMEGIGDGIINRSSWLRNLVTSYVNSIKRSVEASLGIHSPSKVFAQIGEYMAEGMGVGFTEEMNGVRKQMQDSIPTSFDTSVETSPMTDMVNGLVSGLSSAVSGGSNQPIVLQVNLDSKTIAQTIFDPLKSVAMQRGVAYG